MTINYNNNCINSNIVNQDNAPSSVEYDINPYLIDYQNNDDNYQPFKNSSIVDLDNLGGPLGALSVSDLSYDTISPTLTILKPTYGAVVSDAIGNGDDCSDGKFYIEWECIEDLPSEGGSGLAYCEVKLNDNDWIKVYPEELTQVTQFTLSCSLQNNIKLGVNVVTIRAWDNIGQDPAVQTVYFIKENIESDNTSICPIYITGMSDTSADEQSITDTVKRIDLCFNSDLGEDNYGWINVLMSDCQVEKIDDTTYDNRYVDYTKLRTGWFDVFAYPKSIQGMSQIVIDRNYQFIFRSPMLEIGKEYYFSIEAEGLIAASKFRLEIWNNKHEMWDLLENVIFTNKATLQRSFRLIEAYYWEQEGIRIRLQVEPQNGSSFVLYSFKLESKQISYSSWQATYYCGKEDGEPFSRNSQNYVLFRDKSILSRAVSERGEDYNEDKFETALGNKIDLNIMVDITKPIVVDTIFTPTIVTQTRKELNVQIEFSEAMFRKNMISVDLLPANVSDVESNYVSFYNGVWMSDKILILSNLQEITSVTSQGIAHLRIRGAKDLARNEMVTIWPSDAISPEVEINIPKKNWTAKLIDKTNVERQIYSVNSEEILDTAIDPLTQGLFVATESEFKLYYDIDDYPQYNEAERRGENVCLVSISPDGVGNIWGIKNFAQDSYNEIVYFYRTNTVVKDTKGVYRTLKINGVYSPIKFQQDINRIFKSATRVQDDIGNPISILYDARFEGLWVIVRSVTDAKYCYLRYVFTNSGKAYTILNSETNKPFKFIYTKDIVFDSTQQGVWIPNNDTVFHVNLKAQSVDKIIQTGIVRKLNRGQKIWYITKSFNGQYWVNTLKE